MKKVNMSAMEMVVVTGKILLSLVFLLVGIFFIYVMLKNGFSGSALVGSLIGFAFPYWQLKRVFGGKNTKGKREKEDYVSW